MYAAMVAFTIGLCLLVAPLLLVRWAVRWLRVLIAGTGEDARDAD